MDVLFRQFAAFLLIAASSAWGQISLVNLTSCPVGNYPTACSIPSSGAGHLIGVAWAGSTTVTPTISSITDNAGNTYVEAANSRSVDSTRSQGVDIWYAKNSIAGATTVTVTPNPSGGFGAVVIWEFSGIDTTAPLDQAAALNSQASTASPTGPAVTTTAASEAIISVISVQGSATGIASGNPFTSASTSDGDGWAYLITSSAGTYAAQWTKSSAGTYAGSTAAFKAAAATGSTSACDLVTPWGIIDSADVNAAVNMSLGLTPCTANIAGPNVCNVAVVQRVVNAMPAPSGNNTCVTGYGAIPHSVALNWTASTTPNVTYNVYRSTTSGVYGSALASLPAGTTSYSDSTVQAGSTYYYVIRAVDPTNSNNLSSPSHEAKAIISTP